MNLVEATLTDDACVRGLPRAARRRPAPTEVADTVILGIRPQDFEDARTADPRSRIEVDVAVVEELGSATHVLFTIEAPPVDVESVRAASDDRERATLLATDRRALFTAEVAEGTQVRPGERLRLALNPSKLHFFDPASGATLRPTALATA